MAFKNLASKKQWGMRRSNRRSQIGRSFEQEELPKILQRMKDEGLIVGFKISAPFSTEDMSGRDCSVSVSRDGAIIERSFGVTISQKSYAYSRNRHMPVPQFCFPVETKPETIQKRILELFK